MTVKLYLKHPKNSTGELRKTEVSIIAKITKDRRNRFEIPTGEHIIPKYWGNQEVKASYIDHASMNRFLGQFKASLLSIYRDNREKSWTQIKDLMRGSVEKKTLTEAFTAFRKHAAEQGLHGRTIDHYEVLESRLKELPSFNDGFDTFTENFPYKFRQHFKDYKDTYHYKLISRLKTFLSWCKSKNYPTGQEYQSWQIRELTVQPLAFSEDELNALENAILIGPLAIARDYFVVACRTGLRISDLPKLDARNVVGDVLTLTHSKKSTINGGKTVNIFFTPGTWSAPALDILNKHGGKLRKYSEQKIRENLKKACDKAKIHGKCQVEYWKDGQKFTEEKRKCDAVKVHWGKKTFITLALESGMPLKVVSDLSGTSMRTIEKHYAAKSSKKVNEGYLKQMVAKTA